MDLLPIEESACYRRLRDPRIVDSEPFRLFLRADAPDHHSLLHNDVRQPDRRVPIQLNGSGASRPDVP